MLNQKQIEEIFTRFTTVKERPLIELDYSTPYTLLVAVVLSAQSTDKIVNKVTQKLFKVSDTPEKMVELGEEALKNFIRMIGLYNAKAKNIIALSKMLIEKFNSVVPDNLEDLQSLPGVGRKSVNVILNSIFEKNTIGVDTHVFRVSNRVGLCQTKNVLATEMELEKKIPDRFKRYAHHWLVLHGRYICKAKKPLCSQCIINDICQYENKT
ncbi:MAG: endonuclease III [Candidatus Midichloria sp.]|nr:endonuclease III [Candidatus Midichloria sp.]